MLARFFRLFLSLLLLVVAATPIIGGTDLMLWPNGLIFNLHPVMLENTPFNDFLLPGLLSVLLIGGSSLLALLLLQDNKRHAFPVALACGIIIIHYTCLAALCVKTNTWFYAVCWLLGFTIIIISLFAKHKLTPG